MAVIGDIHDTLEPFPEALHECVVEGWRRWKKEFAPRLQLPYRRCRANVVYDLIIEEVRKRLSSNPAVVIVEHTQRCLVKIEDLILRFKKLREGLQTSNYPTQHSLAFDQQMRLPGIPKGTRVTIGYRLDQLEQSLLAVFVVYAIGNRAQGYYELEAAGVPVAMPLAPVVPIAVNQPVSSRITEKRPAAQNDNEEKEEKKEK